MDRLGDMPGETVLREGIRRAGRDSGRRMLERVRSNGLSTNLKNLYAEGVTDRVDDPRVRGAVIVDEDDRRIREIYSCPMAHLWNTNGASRAGSFFCEEFEYARVLAYTEGKGQLNLSNTLTCKRDDFCLFAAFFREANMTPERAEESREKTRGKSGLLLYPRGSGGPVRGSRSLRSGGRTQEVGLICGESSRHSGGAHAEADGRRVCEEELPRSV